MDSSKTLQLKAIKWAKLGDWEKAKLVNSEIIEQQPQDISALNRLAFCFFQLKDKKSAKATYQKVLAFDQRNTIAQKYLKLLKENSNAVSSEKMFDDFIEEPGKTKIVNLDRLAGVKVLSALSVATAVKLKPKGRYVSVLNQNDEYIGSLPEDISYHLVKLIRTGNQYLCLIKTVSKNACGVFIKEKFVSSVNRNTPSFPVSTSVVSDDVEEDLLINDAEDVTDETEDSDGPRMISQPEESGFGGDDYQNEDMEKNY